MRAMPANRKTKSSGAKRPSVKRNPKPKFGADGATEKEKSSALCPIVGIGGSAGGFEAAMEFLRQLPSKTGMAFVIVQHLDPHHASRLSNLLGKVTAMPVSEVTGTTTPRPNTVYVQPPNKCVIAKNGALTLVRREERLNVAIDHFFESLAEECGSRAIGVVLSGTGSDGTAGLRAIKAAGGLTFAQNEESAKFDAMPRSAIRAGFDDLLISVTRFFRDEALFRALKKRFLPALLKNKSNDRQPELRAWVPGCASGEEVYSLAICILETLGRGPSKIRIQIFGTDLSESVIEHARLGIYSSAIEKDVSPARLKRFFVKRDGTYQIHRNVRDICTFARQNITADPPFSRLDLISCRNVLIYLSPELHKRCIPQFHYALNAGGYLILGPAESVGLYDELFKLVDKKNKIYAKTAMMTPRTANLIPQSGLEFAHFGARSTAAAGANFGGDLLKVADRIMLGTYPPAAVVIDEDMHVQQFRGRTDLFLEHAPGPATFNLLRLARPTLVPELRATIRRAIKTDKAARTERAKVKLGGKSYEINMQAVPFKIPGSDKSWLLVIFDETTKGAKPEHLPRALGKTATAREVGELRQELAASKETLQASIEEQQATNEELK